MPSSELKDARRAHVNAYRTAIYDGYGWVLKVDADAYRAERDRLREQLSLVASSRRADIAAIATALSPVLVVNARRDGRGDGGGLGGAHAAPYTGPRNGQMTTANRHAAALLTKGSDQ